MSDLRAGLMARLDQAAEATRDLAGLVVVFHRELRELGMARIEACVLTIAFLHSLSAPHETDEADE